MKVFAERFRNLSAKRKFLLWLVGVVTGAGVVMHLLGFLPTSRYGAREFVMKRDYRDMRRVFLMKDLPASFVIERIHHPGLGPIPGPDGPPPIFYKASVAGADYDDLVARIPWNSTRMVEGYNFRRGAAHFHFEGDGQRALINKIMEGTSEWSPLLIESWTTKTVDGVGYGRGTFIAVDDRSSSPVRLYITTLVPYESEDGYPIAE